HPVTVSGECSLPTPTDIPTNTPTDTPTDTPTATPTNTPTHTPTATPTNTPTRVPSPIYIPVLVKESCKETNVYSDVALVLDMSTSMERAWTTGRTKMAATIDAATAILDRMDFTPDEEGRSDRVAVVGFNGTAWIEQPLTTDKQAVAAALARLPQKEAFF